MWSSDLTSNVLSTCWQTSIKSVSPFRNGSTAGIPPSGKKKNPTFIKHGWGLTGCIRGPGRLAQVCNDMTKDLFSRPHDKVRIWANSQCISRHIIHYILAKVLKGLDNILTINNIRSYWTVVMENLTNLTLAMAGTAPSKPWRHQRRFWGMYNTAQKYVPHHGPHLILYSSLACNIGPSSSINYCIFGFLKLNPV